MRDWMIAAGFFLAAGFAMLVPTFAESNFQRVETRSAFVELVENKPLRRLGIRLDVHPDGRIEGRALGRAVTGRWEWEAGYFCRTLEHGSQVFERNCQTVGVRGDTVRFTADRGAGDTADLRLP